MTFVPRTPVAGDKFHFSIDPSAQNQGFQIATSLSSAVNTITGKTIYTITLPVGGVFVIDQDYLILNDVTSSGIQRWTACIADGETITKPGE